MEDRSTLSISDKSMLEKVLKKSPEQMSTDDIAILRARRDYLTPVERATFAEVLEESKEVKEVKAKPKKK